MKDFCFPRNCFIVGPTGPSGGPTGPTGATGPTGSFADTTTCSCVNQMRNVIQQLQVLYPNTNLIVSMESGNNAVVVLVPSSLDQTTIPTPDY